MKYTHLLILLFEVISAGLKPVKYKNWNYIAKIPRNFKNKIKRLANEELIKYGDLVLTKSQLEKLTKRIPGQKSFTKPSRIWNQYPVNGRFRIALKIDEASFRSDELFHMRNDLPKSVQDFRDKTGIWFDLHCDDRSSFSRLGNVLNDNSRNKEWCHDHWITLTARASNLGGCSSFMGRFGKDWQGNGEQQVSLQTGCAYKNTISHELIHALGWTHEQNRADRDDVIEIHWNFISPSMQYNFNKELNSDDSGSPYDLDSVMQYHSQAFTTNWNYETMTARNLKDEVIGYRESFDRNGEFQRRGLSEWDAYEINYQYNLNEHCASRNMKWGFWNINKKKPKKGEKIKDLDTCVSKDTRKFDCKSCKENEFCAEIRVPPFNECRKRDDPCRKNPCVNGGVCKADFSNPDINPAPFKCTCNKNFFGEFCEEKVLCKGNTKIVFDGQQRVTRFCNPRKQKIQNFNHPGDHNIWRLGKHLFIDRFFRKIQKVNLSRGKLMEINPRSFWDLVDLEELYLQHNRLVEIKDNSFSKNTKLKVLNLSNNGLKHFGIRGLSRRIEEIYLNDNQLLKLDRNVFHGFNSVRKLHIYNIKNPQNELRAICQQLRISECCWGIQQGIFGEQKPRCN